MHTIDTHRILVHITLQAHTIILKVLNPSAHTHTLRITTNQIISIAIIHNDSRPFVIHLSNLVPLAYGYLPRFVTDS